MTEAIKCYIEVWFQSVGVMLAESSHRDSKAADSCLDLFIGGRDGVQQEWAST